MYLDTAFHNQEVKEERQKEGAEKKYKTETVGEEKNTLISLCSFRIQPLSEALGDLYKEFNSLKERLAELTTKFDGVEAFVDDVRLGRSPAPLRGEPRPPGSLPGEADGAGGRPSGRRRSRVIIRRIKKPAGSQDWGYSIILLMPGRDGVTCLSYISPHCVFWCKSHL